ncbi:response regulator [Leptospira interrogans]|uniref:Response regulator containing a signal receiver domain and a DNA/RNA polymerase-binding domain n=16 Tax=Leptospira interrogans TaxID=173 RepID=Q8F1M4_LEPIN|nr:response regulator containing a signal receiver domain and a DNA/RNA polymerase-binding domain [Leptospira interrogans serovar Lai str. 56601]AAS69605.1 response regulator [Leptospira interrogans serovar Copenhageni str. Fiocruz L1-130]AER03292.1 response regulator containing a signal receiver domain and a DNA/RNA polymerase-binding domain [Leptospira interrogans serovar Lai str. IPAV]AKH76495.1 transcriptional regulator [Leptospira interrogans serovar Bratislava]AKP25325.1 transcriptional r
MNPKILVADDDDRIRKMIRISLNASHYEVIESATIQETILKAAKNSPDLILLDLQFPDGNGITALREIRSWSETPVIVLSVLASDPEKISLLDGGADDYITKPFSMGELLARIRVALRNKTQDPGSPIFISGNLYVDLSNRNVKVSGITVHLTPTEYIFLTFLIQHAGKVLTQEQIIRHVWGPFAKNESGSLRVHVASLRKKIELDPSSPELLLTEPGVGYRLAIHL